MPPDHFAEDWSPRLALVSGLNCSRRDDPQIPHLVDIEHQFGKAKWRRFGKLGRVLLAEVVV